MKKPLFLIVILFIGNLNGLESWQDRARKYDKTVSAILGTAIGFSAAKWVDSKSRGNAHLFINSVMQIFLICHLNPHLNYPFEDIVEGDLGKFIKTITPTESKVIAGSAIALGIFLCKGPLF